MQRHTRKRKQLPSYPIIPPYKSSIYPGNDFYSYVNGDWIRHVNMPPYLSSYGVSEEIEGVINMELEDILHNARKAVKTNTHMGIHHPQYLLGTLTESVLNNSSQHLNVKFVHSLVSSLRCIRDLFDIGSSLGDFIRHQISTIFEFIISPMKTDSKQIRLIISPGSLGLPDPSYYITDGKHTTHILSAYDNLLKKLGKEFDIPDLNQLIIMEQRIAQSMIISMDSNEEEILVVGKDLKNKYPNIPWISIFESATGWSETEFNNHEIVVTSTNFLKDINMWFHEISIEDWKRLLSGQILLHMLSLLPPPFDNWDFELFGRRMKGQREKMPQHRLALHLAEQWVGKSLGSEFIRLHVPTIVKTEALAIANEIKQSASRILSTTEWLDENTRIKASIKVNGIYLGVAYPKKIEKNDVAELYPDQMIKNILKLSEMDYKQELRRINTPSQPHVWEDNVFAVNAYYYNEANRLVLPAGILRWPFFHKNASDGWNFGGLGCTIGHEISHAFDDDGKDYDENGNRNPWWSRVEQMRYHKKTKELVELYNKTKYYGKNLNGILTLSENIADLCGVSISLGALNRRIKGQMPEKRKKEMRDFFTSYAVSWRTKEKKEKVLQSLFMDVHAPPSARVNNIVCQFEEWYECFDIQPNHILYKKPDERIRIF